MAANVTTRLQRTLDYSTPQLGYNNTSWRLQDAPRPFHSKIWGSRPQPFPRIDAYSSACVGLSACVFLCLRLLCVASLCVSVSLHVCLCFSVYLYACV